MIPMHMHYSLTDAAWHDRFWFDERPDRTHRLRAPRPDEINNLAAGCTHVIAYRIGKSSRLRCPVVLMGVDPRLLEQLLGEAPLARVQDRILAAMVKAARKGGAVELGKIIKKVVSSFR
jgi:hypothetical protein